jgi:hypothetical protein
LGVRLPSLTGPTPSTARRAQFTHIQGLEAGIAAIAHRLSLPVGEKGTKRSAGGYPRELWEAERWLLSADRESGKRFGNETIRLTPDGEVSLKLPAALAHLQAPGMADTSSRAPWYSTTGAPSGLTASMRAGPWPTARPRGRAHLGGHSRL